MTRHTPTTDADGERHRRAIAANLDIEIDRLRFSNEACERIKQMGQLVAVWQIYYRDARRELPWHVDGPSYVTRDLVRNWRGLVE